MIINNTNNSEDIDDPNEKNHNEILLQLEEIKKLSIIIDNIFLNNNINNFSNPIEFNYNFKKEYSGGFIEYKRTLTSYVNSKINKLIRQIYWRIYEGIITENINLCYYIIGLEDSGFPSYSSEKELENSLQIILETLIDIDLKITYLYLYNSILNYNFIIVKFSLDNNKIEYF